jgi:hypothetical protein
MYIWNKFLALTPFEKVFLMAGLAAIAVGVISNPMCDEECRRRKNLEEALRCGAMIELYAFKEATDCFNALTRKIERYGGSLRLTEKLK